MSLEGELIFHIGLGMFQKRVLNKEGVEKNRGGVVTLYETMDKDTKL